MQAFLEYVVKGLVDHPEAATVTPVERQGVTINAIRSLLLAGSAKKGLRASMEIVESDGAEVAD